MKKQLNIFLATDYSEEVMNAERYAFEFAKKTKSVLTILHVYEIPFSFPSDPTEYARAAERLRNFELQKLQLHCEMLMHSLNIKLQEINWEYIVLEGSVAKEIRKEAERSHPDLIITGAHGSSGNYIFQGNHTWDIIKKSNVPILAIPQDALLTDIRKIVFASEYSMSEIHGIQFLVTYAKYFNAELIVLHITNHAITKEFENTFFEKYKKEVLNRISYDKMSLRIVYSEDIIEGLNNFCMASKADWLVMAHSKPIIFEKIFMPSKSFTKEMSFHTHIPLLSIPDCLVSEKEDHCDSVEETIIYNKEKETIQE